MWATASPAQLLPVTAFYQTPPSHYPLIYYSLLSEATCWQVFLSIILSLPVTLSCSLSSCCSIFPTFVRCRSLMMLPRSYSFTPSLYVAPFCHPPICYLELRVSMHTPKTKTLHWHFNDRSPLISFPCWRSSSQKKVSNKAPQVLIIKLLIEQILICVENKDVNLENCKYHMCWAKNEVIIPAEHLTQLSPCPAFLLCHQN